MKKLIISCLVGIMVLGLMPLTINAAVTQEIKNVNVIEAVNSARVYWYTDKKSETMLYYGDSSEKYSTYVFSDYNRYDHSVTLRALKAGTLYYYKIVTNQGVEQTGTFETLGQKENLVVYQPYFTLLFDNAWENINGVAPTKISDTDGLGVYETGFTGNALKVNRQKSYLQYSCENVFNSGYGTVSAWVKFDRFDKDAVIWQTDDSRYALYYEVGNSSTDFDKRIVARAGGNEDGDYPEAEFIMDPKGARLNQWGLNEWHFLTMTWEGKFSGELELYIDGRRVDSAHYEDATGCSSFRVGNSYRDYDNMNFSIGAIDELKLHQWSMNSYYVNQNYQAYAYSPNFAKKGTPEPQVAGAQIRSFNHGKLLRAPNGKVYVLSRGLRIHIDNLDALKRYKSHPVIDVSWDEINQYKDGGKFYEWSRYPDGTLLKGAEYNTVYWLWDGEKRPFYNEDVFYRYGNIWQDVITISESELATYPTGFTYR